MKVSCDVTKTRSCRLNRSGLWLQLALFFWGCFWLTASFADESDLIKVSVKAVKEIQYYPVKEVPARVISLNQSTLSSEVSARVETVHVKIGSKVNAGQLLASLNCEDYHLNLRQKQAEQQALNADYEFAQYQYQRSSELLKSKSVSRELHRQQSAQVNKLKAQLSLNEVAQELARRNIGRCKIKAPYAGIVLRQMVYPGEWVVPGSALLEIMDETDLELEAQLPLSVVNHPAFQQFLSSAGSTVRLNFVHMKQSFPVVVRQLVPIIESQSRHQKIRLTFSNEKPLPGSFGTLQIHLNAAVIPYQYVVRREQQDGVFLLRKRHNQFYAHFFKLPETVPGKPVEVQFSGNERLIIAGRNALQHGQPIQLETGAAVD
jgi:RND family efflux transporter MFP subunit